MFAPKWPWVAGHRKGKEKMKPNDWWGDPKRKWGSLPLNGRKYKKKIVFGQVSWQTDDSHFHSGLKTKDWDTRDSKVSQASIKSNTKSISPWKKRNSPVEPRQKNKISNFGTFSLTPKLCLPLSLNLKKDKSQEKTFIFMDYPTIYFWHFEHIYVYNRSKELMYFNFTMWSMLLFHAFLSASIRLVLSCLELSS